MSGRLQIGDVSVTLDEQGCVYVSFDRVRIPESKLQAVRSDVVAPGVVVDYDADGTMLGVEIIGGDGDG